MNVVLDALHESLQARGAAQLEPVEWHYITVLSERARAQTGPAQRLLNDKLEMALVRLKDTLDAAPTRADFSKTKAQEKACAQSTPAVSPLAALLKDMQTESANPGTGIASAWRVESPRIRQFRKQLSQISVQKQVSKAMAQAPQNAGPINSHMLVLRSLGLMRVASPDYLSRFMGYVDTLLFLEEAGQGKRVPGKALASSRPK
ncbi:DUF2894 domain-containing protein [Limnohabitans sp. 2KL-17]|uniref:DUF2894 domain-containing protein n=1 Tax=Limnohabitans sp. 2KL-17 TaxID=1100704 RepID=UPI001304EA13|nr:DUF2894 domain-containing protein [Limnohabitans sp. 2KL-17]